MFSGQRLVKMDADSQLMNYFMLQPPELTYKILENFSPEQIFKTCLKHFPGQLADFAFDKILLKNMARIDVRSLHKLYKSCVTKDERDWCLSPLVKAKVSMVTLTHLAEVTYQDPDADAFIKDIDVVNNDGVVIVTGSGKLPRDELANVLTLLLPYLRPDITLVFIRIKLSIFDKSTFQKLDQHVSKVILLRGVA